MPEVTQHGQEGRKHVYFDLNGRHLPILNHEGMSVDSLIKTAQASSNSLKVSSDEVLICAYPKSGLHWIWEVLEMLKKNKVTPADYFMEDMVLGGKATYEKEVPRVFASHQRYENITKCFKEQHCKIVFLARDPRSVAVSYHHTLSSIKDCCSLNMAEFLDCFHKGNIVLNSWLEYILAWDKTLTEHSADQPIYLLFFEDARKDPIGTVKKLNEFLGTGLSSEMCAEIVNNTTIDKLREVKEAIPVNPYRKIYYNDVYPFYRSGSTSGWKNTLTVAENEEFKRVYKDKLSQTQHFKVLADLM